jgi:hypothetical protein
VGLLKDQKKVKLLFLCLCLLTSILFSTLPVYDGTPWLGMQFMTAYHNPRYLVGHVVSGFSRHKFLHT